MASGRVGANVKRELYRDYESIPPRGPLALVRAKPLAASQVRSFRAGRIPDCSRTPGRVAGAAPSLQPPLLSVGVGSPARRVRIMVGLIAVAFAIMAILLLVAFTYRHPGRDEKGLPPGSRRGETW